MSAHELVRCEWVGSDPLYRQYHDEEWGVPVFEDQHLFEMLILEGAQAGLSWITVLRKRSAYRHAFAEFDPEKVAQFGNKQIVALLENPGIIRNQRKIQAAIENARLFLRIQTEFGSFANYIWEYVGGKPIYNTWRSLEEVPSQTPLSQAISRDLYRRGFRFVGPTILYAYMQAVGMVNDHIVTCFRYEQLAAAR